MRRVYPGLNLRLQRVDRDKLRIKFRSNLFLPNNEILSGKKYFSEIIGVKSYKHNNTEKTLTKYYVKNEEWRIMETTDNYCNFECENKCDMNDARNKNYIIRKIIEKKIRSKNNY